MANIYVRSTDGSNSDDGSTWALAKQTLAGADAKPDAAGDVIYVSDAHSESTAGNVTIAFAGTYDNPTRVVCGDDAAEPPTTAATSAIVETTGSTSIALDGSAYYYGITFKASVGSVASATYIQIASGPSASNNIAFASCGFEIYSPSSGGRITIGTISNVGVRARFNNCDFTFGQTGHGLSLTSGDIEINGGSIKAGSAAITGFVKEWGSSARVPTRAEVNGFNFANAASSLVLFDASPAISGRLIFRNCKMPASWSGSPVGTVTDAGLRVEMYNCDNADTNYRLWIKDYFGQIRDETTIVRTGGASDGATSISWKMVTTNSANMFPYPAGALETPEIMAWNETTGSSISATVEVVTDGVTLTDKECWIEVQYLGTSGYPISSFASDGNSNPLPSVSGSNQTTSTETWTTTGLSSPTKQKLSASFTPQEKGFIVAKVKLAKSNTTVYVDPKLTVA